MAHYFISDLHLQASQPQVAEGFFRFIRTLNDAESLYILGDFFEFWVGDDYRDAFVDEVKQAIFQASKRFPIFFMHGNRDFMIGQQFCQETGMTLLNDPHVIKINDRRLLLMHGDSLCTQDLAYLNIRKTLRDPNWQAAMLQKSIKERIAFAQQARLQSRTQTDQQQSSEIMDVTDSEVIKVMTHFDVDMLIHGHTHRPKVHRVTLPSGTGQRMVLGDWGTEGWLIRADLDRFSLISFRL